MIVNTPSSYSEALARSIADATDPRDLAQVVAEALDIARPGDDAHPDIKPDGSRLFLLHVSRHNLALLKTQDASAYARVKHYREVAFDVAYPMLLARDVAQEVRPLLVLGAAQHSKQAAASVLRHISANEVSRLPTALKFRTELYLAAVASKVEFTNADVERMELVDAVRLATALGVYVDPSRLEAAGRGEAELHYVRNARDTLCGLHKDGLRFTSNSQVWSDTPVNERCASCGREGAGQR